MILVDTNELCDALGVDTSTVWRMTREGVLPPAYATTGTTLAFWSLHELWNWLVMPLNYLIRIERLLKDRGRMDDYGRALAA